MADGVVDRLVVAVTYAYDQAAENKVLDGLDDVLGAIAGVAAALVAGTVATAAQVTEQLRLAEALGVTTQAYQETAFALSVYGVDANDAADALTTLADRSKDAQQGTQSFVDDFALVGISVDDLRGKDPVALLDLFAERAGEAGDRSAFAAAAVRTFGDDLGRRLLPLLSRGSDELDRLKLQARQLGAVIDDDTAKAAESLTFQVAELQANVGGLARGFFLDLAPSLDLVTGNLNDWLDANRGVLRADLADAADAIGSAFEALNTPMGRAALAAGGTRAAFSLLSATIGKRGAKGVGLLFLLGLLADDLNTAADGGDSMAGRFAKAFGAEGELQTSLAFFREALTQTGDGFENFIDRVQKSWDSLDVAPDIRSFVGMFDFGAAGAIDEQAAKFWRGVGMIPGDPSSAAAGEFAGRFAMALDPTMASVLGGLTPEVVSALARARADAEFVGPPNVNVNVPVTINGRGDVRDFAKEVSMQVEQALIEADP